MLALHEISKIFATSYSASHEALLGLFESLLYLKKMYIHGGFMVILCINMPIFTSPAGFSMNHVTMQHWTIDASYQAKISTIKIRHDLSPKRIQQYEKDVKTIDAINENFISIFEKQGTLKEGNILLPTWSYSMSSSRFHGYLEENKQSHFSA